MVRAEFTALEGGFVRCALQAQNGEDLRLRVFRTAVDRGWPLRELTQQRQSLEEVFLRVTRKAGAPEPEEA
jgi:hypothetical protein